MAAKESIVATPPALAKAMEDALLSKVQIIGLSGKMGTGKNHVACTILPKLLTPGRTLVICLEDMLKILTAVHNRIPLFTLYGQKTLEDRKLLQLGSMEAGRDAHGEDYWMRILRARILLLARSPNVVRRFIITDCRFPNEVEWIQDMAGGAGAERGPAQCGGKR